MRSACVFIEKPSSLCSNPRVVVLKIWTRAFVCFSADSNQREDCRHVHGTNEASRRLRFVLFSSRPETVSRICFGCHTMARDTGNVFSFSSPIAITLSLCSSSFLNDIFLFKKCHRSFSWFVLSLFFPLFPRIFSLTFSFVLVSLLFVMFALFALFSSVFVPFICSHCHRQS